MLKTKTIRRKIKSLFNFVFGNMVILKMSLYEFTISDKKKAIQIPSIFDLYNLLNIWNYIYTYSYIYIYVYKYLNTSRYTFIISVETYYKTPILGYDIKIKTTAMFVQHYTTLYQYGDKNKE